MRIKDLNSSVITFKTNVSEHSTKGYEWGDELASLVDNGMLWGDVDVYVNFRKIGSAPIHEMIEYHSPAHAIFAFDKACEL